MEFIAVLWFLSLIFSMLLLIYNSSLNESDKCTSCEHYCEIDGVKECQYSLNRDIDFEGFYIDEKPCERGH